MTKRDNNGGEPLVTGIDTGTGPAGANLGDPGGDPTIREPASQDADNQGDAERLDAGQIGADDDGDHDGTGDDQDEPGDGDETPNRREARYRVERNEARQERDAALQQVADLQNAIVADIAAREGLPDAGLLAYSGHTLDTLLGDDGVPDQDKVRAACAEVIRKHRIIQRPAPVPQQGRPGAQGGQSTAAAWAGAFTPKRA